MKVAGFEWQRLPARGRFGPMQSLFMMLVVLSASFADLQAQNSNIVAKPVTADGPSALSVCSAKSPSSVTYISFDGEEAFRIPVTHAHAGFGHHFLCRGYLIVTPTRVAYDGSRGEKSGEDAFTYPKQNVGVHVGVFGRSDALVLEVPGRRYTFALADDDATNHKFAKCDWNHAWHWLKTALENFQNASSEFAALTQSPAVATGQTSIDARKVPVIPSPSLSSEERRKTLETFQAIAEGWRKAGRQVELPQEADRHRILAEAAYNEKDIERALKHFQAAIEIYPTWPQGQFNLAVLCGEIKDYACAYVHMKEYMLLAPDAPDAHTAYEKTVIWEDKLENSEPSAKAPALSPIDPSRDCRQATLTGVLSLRKGGSTVGFGGVAAQDQMILILPDKQEIFLKQKDVGGRKHKGGGSVRQDVTVTVTGMLCGNIMEYEQMRYESEKRK